MRKYEQISPALEKRMQKEKSEGSFSVLAFPDSQVTRRFASKQDTASVWRPAFVRDVDKILYCPFYNRYTDKTQVFSFYKNDDITRRSLHVQLVSRIARTIGRALNLNTDLIEAISLGHDIGHPPFAHSGEKYLDEISFKETGRHFYHNIQSVRVLDRIFPNNISLQTLSGIAAHNGELELDEYRPRPLSGFDEFDEQIERCYTDREYCDGLIPSTLEGCVVRISDIIAFLGKDRHDAALAKLAKENLFSDDGIGSVNQEIINNLTVNIIQNSYGKPYIRLDGEHFQALKEAKQHNYDVIYEGVAEAARLRDTVRPMMSEIFGQLLEDLRRENRRSPIYLQHISYINSYRKPGDPPYGNDAPEQLVIDYIASMTDDYFIDLHRYLFPDSHYEIRYRGYFDSIEAGGEVAHV